MMTIITVWCDEHPGNRSKVAVLARRIFGWERVDDDGNILDERAGGRQIIDATQNRPTQPTSEEMAGFEVESFPAGGARFRWSLACPRGCRAPVFNSANLEPFLDKLADAGMTEVTIRALDARLGGSRTEL